MKDALEVLRHGKVKKFYVPRDVSDVYIQHMNSEIREETVSAGGKPSQRWVAHGANHLWDAEVISTALAISEGIIQITEEFQVKID